MTKIKLNGGFYIEVDQMNYTLKQEYTGKTKSGAKRTGNKIIGYYGRIDRLYQAYLKSFQEQQMEGMTINIEAYLTLVENANKKASEGLLEEFKKFPVL